MIRSTIIVLILSVIFTTACLDGGEAPARENGTDAGKSSAEVNESDKRNTQDQMTELAACQNDFYPIKTNEKFKYKVTGDIPGGYVLSRDTIDDDSFIEKRVFDSGLEVKVNWVCTEEGLRTAEFDNTAILSNANFKMETLESSGVTLPKEWSDGKIWDANYKVKANISAGSTSGSATGTVVITNQIVSMKDAVDVAGKEVQAAKVDSTIKMNLKMGGRRIPSQPVKMTNWFTKEIGLVKSSSSTQFGKSGIVFLSKE